MDNHHQAATFLIRTRRLNVGQAEGTTAITEIRGSYSNWPSMLKVLDAAMLS